MLVYQPAAHRFAWIGFMLLAALSGCDDDPGNRLLLHVDLIEPVVLESACASSECANEVQVRIEYPADYMVDETIELAQYRVDYDLEGVSRQIPFFAAPLDVSLAPGESTTIRVTLLGNVQRGRLQDEVDDATVRGSVTLTLAGYAFDNTQLTQELDLTVEIRANAEDPEEIFMRDGGDGR